MGITRRDFLRGTAAAGTGLLPALAACTPEASTAAPYRFGVASGDPDASSVVLWTRHEPVNGPASSVPVTWEVSRDPSFGSNVASGSTFALPTRDWTVKVIAGGLAPATTYYYRFTSLSGVSPVGRTRTAPSGSSSTLRFAFASCAMYQEGRFHAYRHLANRTDLDAVVHLGDYIYEYGGAGNRTVDPTWELVTLTDYRRRYAWYRLDPDLAEMHRQHPMICIWDDHEFANDPYVGGAQNHNDGEGSWGTRVAAAVQAHAEWMPTRVENDVAYRVLRYGSLASIVLVDRHRPKLWPQADDGDLYLGRAQASWLDTTISGSAVQWLVVAAQSPVASIHPSITGEGFGDRDRYRVLDRFNASANRNLVFASGDFHKFRALDVPRVPANYNAATGAGSTAVEFCAGSIASSGATDPVIGPQVAYTNGTSRGFALLTLTPSAMQTDFYGFDDWLKRSATLPASNWLAGFRCADRTAHYVRAAAPA